MSLRMITIMPMLQAIQQLQWIGLTKKEDAKEDASKDGMEALMTKKVFFKQLAMARASI